MQVLADTLYRQPRQARPQASSNVRAAAAPAREAGSARSLSARVRDYFASGWTLYLDNARAVAPLVHL